MDDLGTKFLYYKIGQTMVSFYADEPKNLSTIRLSISNFKSSVSIELYKMFPETLVIQEISKPEVTPPKHWTKIAEENLIYLLGLVVFIILILTCAIVWLSCKKKVAKNKLKKFEDKFVYKDQDFTFNRERF